MVAAVRQSCIGELSIGGGSTGTGYRAAFRTR